MGWTAKEHILKFVIDQFLSSSSDVSVLIPDDMRPSNAWDLLEEEGYADDLNDILQYDFRDSGEEASLPCRQSRHYESYQMARNLGDVSVSWTYWYGGGKHGEPSEIEWIEDAYFVSCEEVVTTVNVFKKIEDDK